MLAYVIVAVTATVARGKELFPLFNWSLFSAASNPKADTVLIVRSVNGQQLDRPRSYYDMPETFVGAATRNAAAAKTFDLLAAAIRRKDGEAERRIRELIEDNYLREAAVVDYDVASISYDPIERLKTGELRRTVTLSSYEKRHAR